MYKYLPITDVYAREILDSRGNPTVEVEPVSDTHLGENLLGRRPWGAFPAGRRLCKSQRSRPDVFLWRLYFSVRRL